MESNLFGWVEIPVTDMDRAVKFYENVFQFELKRVPLGVLEMAWFPAVQGGSGATGSLVKHPEFYKPSSEGTLVYLSAPSGDLAGELSRVEAAGGSILQPKKQISPEHGYMAIIIDSEGNRLGLSSNE